MAQKVFLLIKVIYHRSSSWSLTLIVFINSFDYWSQSLAVLNTTVQAFDVPCKTEIRRIKFRFFLLTSGLSSILVIDSDSFTKFFCCFLIDGVLLITAPPGNAFFIQFLDFEFLGSFQDHHIIFLPLIARNMARNQFL
jgi:hypothetical protein